MDVEINTHHIMWGTRHIKTWETLLRQHKDLLRQSIWDASTNLVNLIPFPLKCWSYSF